MTEPLPASDTAGIKVLPPLIYLGGLVVGYAIWWFWPLQFVPHEWSLPIRLIGLVALIFGFAVALAPVIAVIRTQVIDKEEAYLEAKFGAPYRDLKARVRRWL